MLRPLKHIQLLDPIWHGLFHWIHQILHLPSDYTILILNQKLHTCSGARVTIGNKFDYTDINGFIMLRLKSGRYDVVVNHPKISGLCVIISGVDFSWNPLVKLVLNWSYGNERKV